MVKLESVILVEPDVMSTSSVAKVGVFSYLARALNQAYTCDDIKINKKRIKIKLTNILLILDCFCFIIPLYLISFYHNIKLMSKGQNNIKN